MRAVRAGIGLVEVARPSAVGDGEALMRVAAFGINRPELLQHQGLYPARKGMTDVLGLEAAGHLEDGGQPVCALLGGGAFAEFCVVKRDHCLPVPPGLSLEQAAGLPECVFTVYNNLFHNGIGTLVGKSVFIHGGSSGVGSTAIAMAKTFGASLVQTTAGSDEKCATCVDLFGADVAFNHRTSDWSNEAEKADVVLDMVGGSYLEKNLKLLRDKGRLVIIGFLESPKSNVNMTRVLLKSLEITGSVLRSAPDDHKTRLRNDIREHVWPLIGSGELKLPFLSRVYHGIENYEQAFADMANGNHCGKSVVSLSS